MKQTFKQTFFALTASALLLTACLPEKNAKTRQEINIPYETFKLSNGLTVIVQENPEALQVAVSVAYHVGMKDEGNDEVEFSHLFEHLMFTGSKHNKGEYFENLERNGVTSLNAYTSPDLTHYMQNAPVNALELVLFAESDRMAYFRDEITQERIDKEAGVVINEQRQRQATPDGILFDAFTNKIYAPEHPYYSDPDGVRHSMQTAKLEKVKDWFDRYYGPNNAVLSLAGKIDVETAKVLAEKYFGHIPPNSPISSPYEMAEPLQGYETSRIEYIGATDRYARAAIAPASRERDFILLEIAAYILSEDEHTSLQSILANKEELVSEAAVFLEGGEVGSTFMTFADFPNTTKIEDVRTRIEEILSDFAEHGPDAEAFERAKRRISQSVITQWEQAADLNKAIHLAEEYLLKGDIEHMQFSLDVVASATADEVREVFKKWVMGGAHHIHMLAVPAYESSGKDMVDRSVAPVPEKSPTPKVAEVVERTLSNKIPVKYLRRKGLKTVDVSVINVGGLSATLGEQSGLSNMALSLLTLSGTHAQSSEEVQGRFADLSAEVSYTLADEYSSIDLSVPSRHFEDTLPLFSTLVKEPKLDEKEFKTKLADAKIKMESRFLTTESASNHLIGKILLGADHPHAFNLTYASAPELIESVTLADLKAHHEKWITPVGAQILVVADMEEDALIAALEKSFSTWKGHITDAPTVSGIAKVRTDLSKFYIIDVPKAEQSIVTGFVQSPSIKGRELESDVILAEHFANIVAGSFSSRVMQNIRADKGWTYGASGSFQHALGYNNYTFYTAVQTDKTAAAIAEVIKEFDNAVSTLPITKDEFIRSTNETIGSLPAYYSDDQVFRSLVLDLMRDGESPDQLVKIAKATEQQTHAGMVEFAGQTGLNANDFVWIIAGDKAKIEADIRALKLGKVEIVETE